VGRLIRLGAATIGAGLLVLLGASAVAAFDGFRGQSATSAYGEQMTFRVTFDGTRPDDLELVLHTPGTDGAFIADVEPEPTGASYVWDTSIQYVTPNTLVSYQWRAIDGGRVELSEPATLRYADDRPGLDWHTAALGETTVHWYGDAEQQARRFGELTAGGVDRAEQLLGTQLAGPVDVFVYDSQEEFFGALGPGAREWTGAATYPEIRTIFMWLGGGSEAYLERAMVHEVTHVVFQDATDNPFHEPATWINEGIAVWSETQDAGDERSIVEDAARAGGLFSFDAIAERFPIGDRAASLSYAQGTTMVDTIIDRYGPKAMSRLTAAYRDGASDEEALEMATGISADALYADFYAAFGVEEPSPVVAEPIGASDVDLPTAGSIDPGGVDQPSEPPVDASPIEPSDGSDLTGILVVGLALAVAATVIGALAISSRRRNLGGRL
jgi:hypothetical protein